MLVYEHFSDTVAVTPKLFMFKSTWYYLPQVKCETVLIGAWRMVCFHIHMHESFSWEIKGYTKIVVIIIWARYWYFCSIICLLYCYHFHEWHTFKSCHFNHYVIRLEYDCCGALLYESITSLFQRVQPPPLQHQTELAMPVALLLVHFYPKTFSLYKFA